MDKPAILSNPEAFVVVPVEPIREQWAAMADTLYRYKNRHHDKVAGDVFNALLSARPDPTALADIVAYCAALEHQNERLSDRIAILGHEREGLTWTALTHDLNRNTSEERAVSAEARIAELEARLAEAERVIEPFARLAKAWDDTAVEDDDPCLATDRGTVLAGDFRAARTWKENGNG